MCKPFKPSLLFNHSSRRECLKLWGCNNRGSNRNNIRVIRNLIRGHKSSILILGNDATVTQNLIELSDTDGISLTGDGADILYNRVRTTTDTECVDIAGNKTLIKNNTLEACAGECIRFS